MEYFHKSYLLIIDNFVGALRHHRRGSHHGRRNRGVLGLILGVLGVLGHILGVLLQILGGVVRHDVQVAGHAAPAADAVALGAVEGATHLALQRAVGAREAHGLQRRRVHRRRDARYCAVAVSGNIYRYIVWSYREYELIYCLELQRTKIDGMYGKMKMDISITTFFALATRQKVTKTIYKYIVWSYREYKKRYCLEFDI